MLWREGDPLWAPPLRGCPESSSLYPPSHTDTLFVPKRHSSSLPTYQLPSGQWFLKRGPRTSSITITWACVRTQILQPHLDLLSQKPCLNNQLPCCLVSSGPRRWEAGESHRGAPRETTHPKASSSDPGASRPGRPVRRFACFMNLKDSVGDEKAATGKRWASRVK